MRGRRTADCEAARGYSGREPRLHRGRIANLLAGAIVAYAVVLSSACSQAAIVHPFLSSLPEAPANTNPAEPLSLSVDHATGQVFVGDDGNGVIDVYSSVGTFVTKFGAEIEPVSIAVDEASGDVYVADPAQDVVIAYRPDGKGGYQLLAEWSGAGTPGGAFGEVAGVAFDNSKSSSDPAAGDLYVLESRSVSEGSSTGIGAIDLFKPSPNPAGSEEDEGQEGQFVGRLGGPKLEEPNAIAVDSDSGRVLVADTEKGAIYPYSDEGTPEEKLSGKGQPYGSFKGKEEEEENVEALAVEETSGNIYVAETEHRAIGEYSPSGVWLGWSTQVAGGEALQEPRGIALGSSGELYGADVLAGKVDVFGAGAVVPDVTTAKASKLARTSAILSGTIDGDGKSASYTFQWGTTEALGQSTPLQSAGSGEEKMSATLEGLHAGTIYYFRIVGGNENGSNDGLIREFETPPAVEGVSTGAVEELEPTSAMLTGSLTPGGFDTHYHFQWGSSTAYGSQTPNSDAGEGSASVEAKVGVGGLSANTTYHYRIVAENGFGETPGRDRTFTTSGPARIAEQAPTGIEHEAAILHAQVDPDQLATSYRFVYGETTAYGSEVPIGGASIGEGSTPVAVEAKLTDLKIGTVYHYRVIAENKAGRSESPDQSFETVAPAPITETYAAEVNTSEATLHSQVDPLGNPTTYYFEYGTESCTLAPNDCARTPTTPVSVGAGTSPVPEEAHLQGLEAASTYYYRVIDQNSLGTTEGPQHTFTTKSGEAPVALADDRAWELVSPVDKHGAPIEALTREGGLILAAEDGNSITYVADGSISEEPEGNRSPEQQQVISTRTAAGWTSQDIATPNDAAHGVRIGVAPEYQLFSSDLGLALVEPFNPRLLSEPPLSPEARQATMYLRDNATGSYVPLVTEANVAPGLEFGSKVHFVSATEDLSHIILKSAVALLGPGSGPGLYEWSEGKLQFVSVLPNETISPHEAELGYYSVAANALSSDGSRAVFTTFEENSHRGHLYMRDTATGDTIQLDAAQGVAEPPGVGTAQFETASSNGSRVFFTDKQKLTPDSTAEPGQQTGKPDLYECEVSEEHGKLICHLRDLTVDHNEGEHATVQNFLFGASADGSYVYAVAQGVLAENENGDGERAQPGEDNLYELHFDGTQWTTTFIALLSSEDKAEWEGELHGNSAYLTARVSPDGRYLAFMSAASPTGYDNLDQSTGKPDEEVYLFDAFSSSLRCVSCNPTGERPAGVQDIEESGEGVGLLVDRRKVWVGHGLAGSIPGWTAESISSALIQSRYLSDEGRLFFDSPDDLVPRASNHKEDVYEYEPADVGTCQSASGGCVSLLSGGSSAQESAFLEATPSGNDVFLLTDSQLVGEDTDTAFDVYDARVCSEASPCLTPHSSAPPECEEAVTCRPAPSAQQPPSGPSGSSTFSGPATDTAQPTPSHETKAVKTGAPKRLTRAQKLALALKTCRREHAHSKAKRRTCEAKARRLYDPKPKAKAKKSARRKHAHSSGRRAR